MPDPSTKQKVETQEEKDRALAEKVRNADVVILVNMDDDGMGFSGMAHHKVLGSMPWTLDAAFAREDGDPPGNLVRQVTVKAGWSRADWRKLDRSALHTNGDDDA